MEEERVGFIQEALRGFLKCLGLESGGGKGVAGDGEGVNNPPPSQPPLNPAASATYEALPAANETSTTDPLVEVLSSPIDNTAMITTEIDNNVGTKRNFTPVTIDEIINTSGGATANTDYVDLPDGGQANMALLTTRLISSGGGGKSH